MTVVNFEWEEMEANDKSAVEDLDAEWSDDLSDLIEMWTEAGGERCKDCWKPAFNKIKDEFLCPACFEEKTTLEFVPMETSKTLAQMNSEYEKIQDSIYRSLSIPKEEIKKMSDIAYYGALDGYLYSTGN